MARATLIGIDVGTTAVKAVLIDLDGQLLAGFTRGHATSYPQPGHAEQDPDQWMRGVTGALEHFTETADLSGLKGVGLCSQVNTHVFVDAGGTPLLPAITWQDGRCAPDAARIEEKVTPEQKTAWFGGPVPIDASHALARMAQVARTAPDLYARTRHVLLPKDYCALALTGEAAADPVAAVGLVDTSSRYVDELAALVPGAREKLPPLFDFTHVVGEIRQGMPCAGTPVILGAMDAWAGMFGLGVIADGDAMYQCGTSEIPGIVSSTVVPTPGVVVFPPHDGITMHAAPTQSGGAALAWLGRLVGKSPAELDRLAAAVPPERAIPLFLPHLQGERAPVWDAEARGAFIGLDGAMEAPEMALSVMEGVALSVRWAFEALEHSAGRTVDEVVIGGGGARSDTWCQIRADILGKTLHRAAIADSAALGAAILAGVGCGAMPSIADAASRLVRIERSFTPDTSRGAYAGERYATYRDLYEMLRSLRGNQG